MSSEILQHIERISQPLPPPNDAWSFLSPSANVRCLAVDGAALLTGLQQQFCDEVLLESRVARRDQDDALCISPVLAGSTPSFLLLRPEKNGPPHDLVNTQGSLLDDAPPAFAAAADYFTASWSRSTRKIILAAATMEDLAVCRALRLPVTVAAGLDRLTGAQLRLLCGPPRARDGEDDETPARSTEPGQRADICRRGLRLVLMDWQLARLSREKPTPLKSTVAYLAEGETALGFSMKHVCVWRPTQTKFRGIRMAARARDADLVRDLMCESLRESLHEIRHYRHGGRAGKLASRDYSKRRESLLEDFHRRRRYGLPPSPVETKLEDLHTGFEVSVIRPLLDEACSPSTGAIQRTLLLSAAELMEHWHQTSVLVRNTAQENNPRAVVFGPEEMKSRLQLIDRLVRMLRELTRPK